MMAETVKKSRIVSDDQDLEESLMQEFNMRLKTCLSTEKLTDEEEEEEEENSNSIITTTITPVQEATDLHKKTNGNAYHNHHHTPPLLDLNKAPDAMLDVGAPPNIDSMEEFLRIERACLESRQEQIAEPTVEDDDEDVEAELAAAAHAEPSISAKDRMLLSTDSASCLLFTQTITSPMLTPSDERVDFMKGFTQESEETTSPPTTISDDNVLEAAAATADEEVDVEECEQGEQDLDPTEPEVDQHDAELDQPEVDQLQMDQEEEEEEEVEEPGTPNGHHPEEDESPDLLRDVMNVPQIEISPTVPAPEGPRTCKRIVTETLSTFEQHKEGASRPQSTTPTDLECKLPSVKTLKDQYIKTASSEAAVPPPTSPKFEKAEMSQLKSLDIMKQISRFEQISPSKEAADSTEVTETSHVVETTIVETMNGDGHVQQQQQVQKKKTKKKSRSHASEKENISVCDLDSRFYNVNVKSLCRSFGDLTKLPEENHRTVENNKSRAKSMGDIRQVGLPPHHHHHQHQHRHIENVFNGVNVKALKERFSMQSVSSVVAKRTFYDHCQRQKSSFSKFDALQKKNVLHVRSTDSSKTQEKFNSDHEEDHGNQADTSNCKSCGKVVFQMEQMKAERSMWHKNCFRCMECNKQLTVDTYQSHEGTLYCKPHFKALFSPKAVEEDNTAPKPRKHELIIRENQPEELPPDVVRASDKPDLGLEELHSLNVKERFQVFEQHTEEEHQLHQLDRSASGVKRSSSILSKLARFQAKGMDIGVGDESLNGIPIEESSTEEERELDEDEDEDADLVRAKRVQREKPFHFTGMSDVKSKWENGEPNGRDERREERKQEIQNIRNRLFMGKQGKMKEMYQQAVMESESGANVKRTEQIEVTDTRSLKERFEKGGGELELDRAVRASNEEEEVFESAISKKSRSLFKELDANATKSPSLMPTKSSSKIFNRQMSNTTSSEEVVKADAFVEEATVETADIQQRFKFFETYKAPERERRRFRITPPRDGQVKMESPDREVYRDPDVIRAEEAMPPAEDSVVAVKTQTAKKMLNKFRQMEEDSGKEHVPMGPKPLKRFTPPPEPIRSESDSEEEEEDVSDEADEESDADQPDAIHMGDNDLLEAQKAARAKQLRAKFEKWEANEIRREQNNSSVNIVEEFGEEQSQIESTKSLRARFESMNGEKRDEPKTPRPKVNRFVPARTPLADACLECKQRVYPLEKISVHGAVYHKKCFKCMECHRILRMDSYSYNQGRLYCTTHFKRLFITKGNYDTAFGLEQHKEKWNTSVA